jgi:hypothetical protein
MYNFTLSLTSVLNGVGGQRHTPATLPPEISGTHCTVYCVGPRALLDGCGKCGSYRDSIPGPSRRLVILTNFPDLLPPKLLSY